MIIQTNNLSIVVTVLTSAVFGTLISLIINRKKLKADTGLALIQSKLVEIEIYSTLYNDLKSQMEILQKQILNLQSKETEYLKIISQQNSREKALQKRILDLESEVATLKTTLKKYENQTRMAE
jgi:peptidoglycan hydrolase CwlO-like protein